MPQKNEFFCGKVGKILQLSLSQRSYKNQFLIGAEVHDLVRHCEDFIESKIFDEEGNKTQQAEIVVERMKEFED